MWTLPADPARRARASTLLAVLLWLAAFGAVESAAAAPADRAEADVDALYRRWPGVYDDREQTIFDARDESTLGAGTDRRVRTRVAPVVLPWLGTHVLYLEELLRDEPATPRRQLLLELLPEREAGAATVRVRQLTLREPARWRGMGADELGALGAQDVETMSGCDLLFTREGDQFRGGTVGRGCLEGTRAARGYVDYRMLLGPALYWYRTRVLQLTDDALVAEIVGYDWFELHQARLYACRVSWAARGAGGLAPLATFDVHDQGGRARFGTPDGRSFAIELHSGDWPFDPNRDALILTVRELGGQGRVVSSWTELDAPEIQAQLDSLEVRCGELSHAAGGID